MGFVVELVLEHPAAMEGSLCLLEPEHIHIIVCHPVGFTKYKESYLDGGQEDTLLPLCVHGGRRQQLKGLGGEEEGKAHQSWGGDKESWGGGGEDKEGTWS